MTECDRRSFLTQAGATVAALGLLPEFTTAAPQVEGGAIAVTVIGAGRQGRAILGELSKMDAVRIVAMCDIDERRLASGLRRAPGAEGFSDYEELLEENPQAQAVFIATPTHLHRDIAINAISAGRHVYCEAPLASTLQDCSAIAAAARSARTIVQPGLQARSNPIYKLARSFYRSDAVRELIAMRAQSNQKTTWRTPASDPVRERRLNWRLDPEVSIGLAGEMGTHQFDAVHWFVGRYPTSVTGSGSIRLHDDDRQVADTVHCDLTFDNGVHLQYQSTLASSFESTYEVFYGSNATIKLARTAGWMFKEADAPTQGWEVYALREQFHNDEGITLIADATKLAAQGKLKEGVSLPQPPLYYAITDFLTSIIEDKPPVCSAEEGMRATAVGILANQAIVTGKRAEIDESILKGE